MLKIIERKNGYYFTLYLDDKKIIFMKHQQLLLTLLFQFIIFLAHAQPSPLEVNSNIVLPKDSIESRSLMSALNNFLALAQKPDQENNLIAENEKIETSVLLDEIKGLEKSGKFANEHFYKPYLMNVVPLEGNSKYMIQVSFVGTDNSKAYQRALVTLIAHKSNQNFTFSSPLSINAKDWKRLKVGNNTFCYRNKIDNKKIKEFEKLTTSFDKKLKVSNKSVEYYCCDNTVEAQRLFGLEYKSDYNGRSQSSFSAAWADKKLVVLGNGNSEFNEFDPHDLWHDRLGLVVSRSLTYRPIDEGCAYLYGGSWGFSWEQIFSEFKSKVTNDSKIDWCEVKEKPLYFKTGDFNNSADNIASALLVKYIEKEKGFEGVWQLLNCGKQEPGNIKFYQSLEKVTGVTKDTYNKKIWELVSKE